MKFIRKEQIKFLELGFKLLYLCLGMATFNSFLYDSSVQPILVKICLILGIVTIIGRVFYFRDYLKTPYILLQILFCISFCLTIAVNWKYGTAFSDIKWVIWTGFLFFLLYTCDTARDVKEYKKEFAILSEVVILFSVISAVASLYLMFERYHNLWMTESGETLIAGFQWGRLWGVYTDPNYGGVFSTVGILLSLYFLKTRKGFWKIWYLIVILADYMYIIFSDSRTAEVCMCIGMGVIILFFFVYTKQNWKGALLGIVSAILFSVVFVSATSFVKDQYNSEIEVQIKQTEAISGSKESVQKEKTSNGADSTKTVGREQDIQSDVSNGRFSLWKSGIEIWKTKPIIGTGYNSFLPYVKENLPDTYVVNNPQGDYVSLHNGYINILVYQGVIGAVVFLVFMCGVLRKWYKGIKSLPREDIAYIGILTACCGVIAVSMVFLLEGVYTNSPGAFVLWTFLGYCMQYFTKKS